MRPKEKSLIKVAVLLVISVGLIGLATLPVAAQKSVIWSPPDKSISVEVPALLEKGHDYGESTDGSEVCEFWRKAGKVRFLVMILKYPDYPTTSTEDKFGGLWFVLGGDDDYNFEERDIRVEGRPAKEIIYREQSVKGIFIDAGDTVYVLGISAEERKHLDSEAAKRFFRSFKIIAKN